MNQGDVVTSSTCVVMGRQPPSKRQVAGSNPAGVAKDANWRVMIWVEPVLLPCERFVGSWSFPIEDLGLPVALTEGALEPSTWAMMLLGCEPGLCGLSRKRQRHRFDAGNHSLPDRRNAPRQGEPARGGARARVRAAWGRGATLDTMLWARRRGNGYKYRPLARSELDAPARRLSRNPGKLLAA